MTLQFCQNMNYKMARHLIGCEKAKKSAYFRAKSKKKDHI